MPENIFDSRSLFSDVFLEVEFYRDVEIDHDVLSDSTDIVLTFQLKCFCLIWLFSYHARMARGAQHL